MGFPVRLAPNVEGGNVRGIQEERTASGGAKRRTAMAVLLTAGMLVAMASFSGVSFAKGSHGTPAHDQYKKH
jgi:hypothetical protein